MIYTDRSINNNKVTIVTVVFNDKVGLEDTILSVLNQSYQNIEYLIIDGGSTDGTVDVIRNYENHLAYWCSEPDGGIYDAMNKGINRATGEWIIFMNAKDKFADSFVLQKLHNYFISDTDVIIGNTVMDDHQQLREFKARKNRNISSKLTTSMGFYHQSSLVRTALAKQYPFDVRYHLAADFGMFFELYRNQYKFVYVDFPISYFDTTGVSMNNVYQGKLETFNILRPNSRVRNKILAFLLTECLRIRSFVDSHIIKVIK